MYMRTCYSSNSTRPDQSFCVCITQGQTQKAKTEEEVRKHHQQRVQVREQCSVGMQPGHFVMLSRQCGNATKLLQGQRNKRKAAQAFDDAPLNGELSHLLPTLSNIGICSC